MGGSLTLTPIIFVYAQLFKHGYSVNTVMPCTGKVATNGLSSLQATAMYKESESEKESVIAKLGVLEEERKKLIEEITTSERKLKETSKVSYICGELNQPL